MKTEMNHINVTEFCRRENITATARRVDSNPQMDDRDMDHWSVTLLRCNGKLMTIPFSMGRGLGGKAPEADDVMNCLASDATVEDMTFDDFCAEFGYDTDSRKAEATFKACQNNTAQLARFLGTDLLKELVYEVERL